MSTENREVFKAQRIERPPWLKVRLPGGKEYASIKNIVKSEKLHTVCEEARCPNIGECWNAGTATFMILGDICTRSCRFCAVKTGRPSGLDAQEPYRVAEAVKTMNIHHAVITSVDRDDLVDGGAQIFADTIRQIKLSSPETKVEVLIPDFKGDEVSLDVVLNAFPDVLNHNVETVPRLYPIVRPQASYSRSLELLDRAKRRGFVTKTGLMVGIGEKKEEVLEVMMDVRKIKCDIITIGQYLQPTREHIAIDRYVGPDEFKFYSDEGYKMGFKHVESGPLVRSSYHAQSHIL